MYVILLKSLSEYQDDPYAKVLKENDFKVSVIETLEFTFQLDDLKNICPDLLLWDNYFSAIIFTSPRAVQAFKLSGLPIKENVICFVVGNATKSLAESIGFETIGADSGNAETLLDIIVNYNRSVFNKPILFPCGTMHRPVLPQKLEENGIEMKLVIVYSTKESTNLSYQLRQVFTESQDIPDLLIFFSPSGILFSEKVLKEDIMPKFSNIKFGSLGPSTSSQLRSCGFNVAFESKFPKPESMLNAIRELISDN